ncbi:MAG: polysaccharide biosynthesis tyrosine autokinase [Actinomycetota bacterium]|nr:polysaccharide biosynthesis tyrosine autokinase [Actinomycetota bacterium]
MQTENTFDTAPLDLREYLGLLRLRKWMILVVTGLVVGGALLLSYRQTPIYESQAKVLVKGVPLRGSALTSLPNLETERELLSSQAVADLVDKKLENVGESDDGLGTLSVSVAVETEILIIKFSHPQPVQAQLMSQTYAEAYLDFRRKEVVNDLVASSEAVQQQIDRLNNQLQGLDEKIAAAGETPRATTLQTRASAVIGQIAILRQQLSDLTPPERLRVGQIVEPADVPSAPASPNHLTNGVLGLIGGLALGIAAVFLRERLDDRLRGRPDLESRVGAPVLAVVPQVSTWRRPKQTVLVTREDPKSAASEAYRTLRTGVLFAASRHGARTLLVTSAEAGEGKTATTANLGVALAQANKRVILVSADLRRPRLSTFFGVPKEPGLTNLLQGEIGLAEALMNPGIKNLRLLPSGPVPHDPAELLGSEATRMILQQLAHAADFVLLDGPPILALADAIVLAPLTDGVLYIADAQKTGRSAVDHARQQLDQVQASVIGCVLNNFNPSKAGGYQYQYRYYYSERYGDPMHAGPADELGSGVAASNGGRRSGSDVRR